MNRNLLLGLCLAGLLSGCKPAPQSFGSLETVIGKQFESWQVANKPDGSGPYRIPEGTAFPTSAVGNGISGSCKTPHGEIKAGAQGIAGHEVMIVFLETPAGELTHAVLKRAR